MENLPLKLMMLTSLCLVLVFSVLSRVATSYLPVYQCGVNFAFSNYYADTMVLQRSPASAVIWGYAFAVGDTVTVTLAKDQEEDVYHNVAENGMSDRPVWRVHLTPADAGGPYAIKASSHDCILTLNDVLFGDVWLCSGQSNMYHRMDQINDPEEDIENCVNYPNVRTLFTQLVSAEEPQEDAPIYRNWALPTPDIIAEYSAVCWLFGIQLYEKFNVPIGLIHSSWSGTRIEAWSSPKALQVCFPDSLPPGAGAMYNSMIHPFQTFPIYGSIWYQGESNFDNYQDYACAQKEMVDDWRASWFEKTGSTDPQFPFGLVQLAPNAATDVFGHSYPNLRWEQSGQEGNLPSEYMQRFFMAVAIDLADFDSPYGSFHPRYKRQIADRLALAAFNVAYEVDLDTRFQGPLPSEFQRMNDQISIIFDNGLVELEARDTNSTVAYQVCCATHAGAMCTAESTDWLAAEIAEVQGANVLIDIPCFDNEFVMGVRYAWKESPCPGLEQCAVYSVGNGSLDLPAPPFVWNGLISGLN